MAHTIEELIPEYIRGLPVYVPGRPIEEVERELKIHAIKLASNENPLGPSPKAIRAVEGVLAEAHRYPDGGTHRLREKLARLHGVQPDEIFVALGSSEIIDIAARVSDVSRSVASRNYQELMPIFNLTGRFNPKALNMLSRSFIELGLLPDAPDMSRLYTEAFLPK